MTMNKKGFILVAVITLLAIAAIFSMGLYNAVYLAGKMQGVDEVRRIRGYYAATAGLSYARVILASPSIPSSPIYISSNSYTALYNDLGLTGSEQVVITYTERSDHSGYDVASKYIF